MTRELEKLRHELEIHHKFYRCVPRSVVSVRIENLEEEVSGLRRLCERLKRENKDLKQEVKRLKT